MVRLKVKEIAKQKGISQRKLFLRSGVDLRTLQRIWANEYTNITLDTLGRLAYGLGVDSSELIEGVAEIPEHMRDLPPEKS
jgi:transcriptional regulator with XRE-family HTH domain